MAGYKNTYMKKIIYAVIALAAMMASFSACTKKSEAESVNGVWEMVSSPGWDDAAAKVYIEFTSPSFKLYQKINSGSYHLYTGTFNVTDGVLTGKYSDGVAFGSGYRYEISGTSLALTPVGNEAGITVYQKVSAVPQEVLDDALSQLTKSADEKRFL